MLNYCLVGILIDIAEIGKTNAKEISEKYEISLRTVYRYLDILESSGIPLVRKRGSTGGISLPQNYNLHSIILNENERHILKGALCNSDNDSYKQRLSEKLNL